MTSSYDLLVVAGIQELPVSIKKLIFFDKKLFDREQRTEYKKYLLASPWEEETLRVNAYEKFKLVYNELLPIISHKLNKEHNSNFSKEFWRIMAGPWLMYFTVSVIDKYEKVKIAHKHSENLVLLNFSESEARPPKNTGDSAVLLQSDENYNQILHSKIASLMGIDQIKINIQSKIDLNTGKNKSFNWWIKWFLGKFCLLFHNRVNLCITPETVPKWLLFKFILRNKLKVFPISFVEAKLPSTLLDKGARQRLSFQERSDIDFVSEIICSLLSDYLPMSLLEDFKNLTNEVDTFCRRHGKLSVVTSSEMYTNERFKLFCSLLNEKKKLTLNIYQHGGDYGVFKYHLQHWHETTIANDYYSWGGSYRSVECTNIIPLCSNKTPVRRGNEKGGIIYISDNQAPYPVCKFFDNTASFEFTKDFFSRVPYDLIPEISVRLVSDDYGWDKRSTIEKICRGIQFDNLEKSFIERLRKTKLMVVDHVSTTYLEALAANVPVIIFCPLQAIDLTDEAKKWFEKLKAVGIFHDSPESAISWIRKVYFDIDKWWFERSVQNTRMAFCDAYCRYPDADLISDELGLR